MKYHKAELVEYFMNKVLVIEAIRKFDAWLSSNEYMYYMERGFTYT